MNSEAPIRDDSTLASVRRRGQGFLGYLLWLGMLLCMLWALHAAALLVADWVALLQGIRGTLGLPVPRAGPDYWILSGVAALALVIVTALAAAWSMYRRSWNRRLRAVWGHPPEPGHTRVRRLKVRAGRREVAHRSSYLEALLSSPQWSPAAIRPPDGQRASYQLAAAEVLSSLEPDIAQRAVAVGLVVGLNRSPAIDAATIAVAALELQLHVLTRLGKRPSLQTWIELLKRTGASLFLNTYVSREDALYLNLAIRKAALGLEMAADATEEAASALADIDWDDVLGDLSIPGVSAAASVAGVGLGVGAFGMRQLGSFIEATASDLLQGVLAAGVLYYHGMAVAAHTLSLDEEHRHSPEMIRTIGQAMSMACTPAGRLLREQVRRMRQFLRERRRLAFSAAKGATRQTVDKVVSASSAAWDSLRGAAGRIRQSS